MASDYTTGKGTRIPGVVMATVARRIAADEDWQKVATENLRAFIADDDDDLDEVMEVLREAELRATPDPRTT